MRNTTPLVIAVAAILSVHATAGNAGETEKNTGRLTADRRLVELRPSQFVYRLDASDGLRGIEWENRLTNKALSLGSGPEVELDFDAAEQWIPCGGWPIEAAIDGNSKTGWSIDPQEGQPHVAVFELEKPIGYPGGTIFTFTLEQGCREPSPQHLLGRIRLATTTVPGSVPLPIGYGPEPIRVRGIIPPTAAGGVLVVAVELRQGDHAWTPRNTGSYSTAEASAAGRSLPIQPVLGSLTYEVPWQAWRIPVTPGSAPRDFEISIHCRLPADVSRAFSAYFVPE